MRVLTKLFFGGIISFLSLMALQAPTYASEAVAATSEAAAGGHGGAGIVFLMLVIVLVAAKVGNIVERFGQPAVLGELIAGILLSAAGFFGLGLIDDIRHNEIIGFMAELGAALLLFQIGLESNIGEMKKVGLKATIVAIIGVVAPFALGTWVLGPWLFPNETFVAHLFLGAALVATSVGITASVFQALKITKSRAAQTVLGAAVIDDVLGLIVLAVVSALATGAEVTPVMVGIIAAKAFGFLAAALIIGRYITGALSKAFSAIHTGIGMKLTMALSFALIFAYLATLVGLAPIIGAFAAGLLLEHVHFKSFDAPSIVGDLKPLVGFESKKEEGIVARLIEKHSHTHVEDLVGNLSLLFVPVFFAYTGLQIDFGSLLNPGLYITALVVAVAAIVGKLIAGIAASGDMNEKLLVGTSMIPRGEVGLIFAATGQALGAISAELFSIIIIVVIITTLAPPPFIKMLALKQAKQA